MKSAHTNSSSDLLSQLKEEPLPLRIRPDPNYYYVFGALLLIVAGSGISAGLSRHDSGMITIGAIFGVFFLSIVAGIARHRLDVSSYSITYRAPFSETQVPLSKIVGVQLQRFPAKQFRILGYQALLVRSVVANESATLIVSATLFRPSDLIRVANALSALGVQVNMS